MPTPCQVCQGACCESLLIPIQNDSLSVDFWKTRGEISVINGDTFVEIESKCRHLVCGLCSIYVARPEACRVYEVGSIACIETIKTRRKNKADLIISLIQSQTK